MKSMDNPSMATASLHTTVRACLHTCVKAQLHDGIRCTDDGHGSRAAVLRCCSAASGGTEREIPKFNLLGADRDSGDGALADECCVFELRVA
jgi:hypothetical protein